MAVRSSMAALIARVRQLIGDPSGASQDFADQDVQDACDAHRMDVRYELLRPAPDIQPPQGQGTTAQFVWAAFFSEFQHWEDDVVFQGMYTPGANPPTTPWAIVSPLLSEPIAGRWTFAVTLPSIATPPAQFPPLYILGKVYDLYRIAADLLERRIALKSATVFDFTSDGQTFRMGQILDRWERLRTSYLNQAWTHSVELVRTDMAVGRDARRTPIFSDAQGNLLPGVLGADVTQGSGSGTGGSY